MTQKFVLRMTQIAIASVFLCLVFGILFGFSELLGKVVLTAALTNVAVVVLYLTEDFT